MTGVEERTAGQNHQMLSNQYSYSQCEHALICYDLRFQLGMSRNPYVGHQKGLPSQLALLVGWHNSSNDEGDVCITVWTQTDIEGRYNSGRCVERGMREGIVVGGV